MGANLSTPEKISKLCRSGDSANLQLLLADLQRNDSQFRANRARYLEVTDEHGNTPLTLAAARGHLACIKLLLQFGSNVHHVNRKPDGGSALHEAVAHKHEGVVELLLRHGANPFVENCKGFTAMDIACSTRNVPLLRRLEQCAPYAGWLQAKVPQFGGLGSSWQRRWVVVSHRFPNPQAPPSRQLTHCVLLAYKSLAATAPSCRVWLDGARAREVYHPKAEARLQLGAGGGARVAQAGVTLHRKHEAPSGVYTTGGHAAGPGGPPEGFTFYLRPDDGSQAAVNALDKLIRTVNNRGFPVPDAPGVAAGVAVPEAAGVAVGSAAAPAARPQLPPAAAGPLYSSLMGQGGAASAAAGVPDMALTPGIWSTAEPGVADGATDSDEAIARRLQEQYDAEVAAQMQQQQDGGGAPGGAPGAVAPQPSPPSAPPPPPATADLLTGGGFYPAVHFGDSAAGPPPTLQQQDQLASAGSGAGAASAPDTPAGPPVASLQSFGRPTAPALLDLDYPPLPLAAGAAALGGQPTHLPIATSGRHMSAPRLEDDAWLADVPAAPPSRAASDTAGAAAAAAAAGRPANDADDSAVCVFCMDAAATAGVLHGDSVHRCLCRECAVHLKESSVQLCPMCREPIQAYIMRVF